MAQIDIEHAKKEFDKYLMDFDLENPKILLKKVHTYGVVKAADYICTREALDPEDKDLALLIALLHDIGRFEQLKAYNSYDDNRFDHAGFGVKLLFEEGKIKDKSQIGDPHIQMCLSLFPPHTSVVSYRLKDIFRNFFLLDSFLWKIKMGFQTVHRLHPVVIQFICISDNLTVEKGPWVLNFWKTIQRVKSNGLSDDIIIISG